MLRLFSVTLILLVFAPFLSAYTEALSNVMEQWDIRAKVAEAKFKGLLIELEAMKMPHRGHEQDRETFNKITGQLALESAYVHHFRYPDAVQKRIEGGMEFHMLLNGATEGMFRLVYTYSESGLITGATVEELPEGWVVRREENEHPLIFVTTSRQEVYSFDLTKPFTAVYWGSVVPPSTPSDTPEVPKGI